jgi:hypothetical protein
METVLENTLDQKPYQKKAYRACCDKIWEVTPAKYMIAKSYIRKMKVPNDQYNNWLYLAPVNWLKYDDKFSFMLKIYRRSYFIPNQLKSIALAINESKWICNLKEDWDYDGASIIDKEIYLSAIDFLINYSIDIFKKTGIVINTPEINPCKDGSIDLSWRTTTARMLVNIRKTVDELLAYYYGDLSNNKSPIKGNVHLDSVYEHLATWMKSLA